MRAAFAKRTSSLVSKAKVPRSRGPASARARPRARAADRRRVRQPAPLLSLCEKVFSRDQIRQLLAASGLMLNSGTEAPDSTRSSSSMQIWQASSASRAENAEAAGNLREETLQTQNCSVLFATCIFACETSALHGHGFSECLKALSKHLWQLLFRVASNEPRLSRRHSICLNQYLAVSEAPCLK